MSEKRQLEFTWVNTITGSRTPDVIEYTEPRRVQPLGAPVVVPHTTSSAPILSQDSAERKNTPIFSGVLQYFPLAIAAVARHSKRSNDKHNPGEPLHWAREKSDDHTDCIARHLVDVDHYNAELDEYEEAAALAWRALAKLQLLEEKRLGRSK